MGEEMQPFTQDLRMRKDKQVQKQTQTCVDPQYQLLYPGSALQKKKEEKKKPFCQILKSTWEIFSAGYHPQERTTKLMT